MRIRFRDLRGARYVAAAAFLALIAAASGGPAGVYGIDRQPDNGWKRAGALVAAAETGSHAPGAGEVPLSEFKPTVPPEPVADLSFIDAANATRSIKDWRGRVVLLNLWATWCAPCRHEMPALDRLQEALGGKDFEVVALSVDRAGLEASRKFLEQTGSTHLKLYVDPSARAAASLKVLGMPTTLLIDRQGRELGRLVGPAAWDSEGAKALIAAAMK